MSLSSGRDLFMTPGPSVIPDRVLNAMHRAAPNIYEGPLVEQVEEIVDMLRKVARTKGHPAIYISNGHGIWEAAISNIFEPGDKMLALATGRFGIGWADVARRMGVDVQVLDFGSTHGFDGDRVADALRADPSIKAVTSVQTDTSTSVCNDIPLLRKVLDDVGHDALLMVDCIASLGTEVHEMDNWGVDVMVAGCQKGLMTPPGLGFTFHNDKAESVSRKVKKLSPYWDWEPRTHPSFFYQHFGGTAPTHHLFALYEALTMMMDEGMENIWSRHQRQAEAIWAAADRWSEGGAVRLNVPNIADRSRAVTTFLSDNTNLTPLRKWCLSEAGLTLGIGLSINGPGADNMFRIGHMGHMNPPMLLGALATVDAGLKALAIPHGNGAVEVATQALITG